MVLLSCDRPTLQPKEQSPKESDSESADIENINPIRMPKRTSKEADRMITQAIRRVLISDDDLSMNGKNIEIITSNGFVTFRGVVENDHEKNWIEKKVSKVEGIKGLDNQLSVKTGRTADYFYN